MANVLVYYNLAIMAIESMFYGIFCALFVGSILLSAQNSLSSGARSSSGHPIYTSFPFFGGIALFLTITPHWILNLYRNFRGFTHFTLNSDEQLAYFIDTRTPLYVTAITFSALVPTVADLILTYRLWLLWNRKIYIVIFPLLTLTAGLAAGGVTIYKDTYGSLLSSDGTMWDTICYALTLSTSAYCTCLIFWRLWRSGSRSTSSRRGAKVSRILVPFTESAVLYMGIEFLCFILSAIGSGSAWVTNEALIPITGIAFMLINVLVWSGHAAEPDPAPASWPVRVPQLYRSHGSSGNLPEGVRVSRGHSIGLSGSGGGVGATSVSFADAEEQVDDKGDLVH